MEWKNLASTRFGVVIVAIAALYAIAVEMIKAKLDNWYVVLPVVGIILIAAIHIISRTISNGITGNRPEDTGSVSPGEGIEEPAPVVDDAG